MPTQLSPSREPTRLQGARTDIGAWVPWEIATAVMRLALKPASHSQVFTAILLVWCRYGQREARLTVAELAEMTGLSKRTAQAAVSALLKRKLVARNGRRGRLRVTVLANGIERRGADMLAPCDAASSQRRSASMSAPSRRTHDCASPTVSMLSSLENVGARIFTPKQLKIVADLITEASELLGHDAGNLTLEARYSATLELPAEVTYNEAFQAAVSAGKKAFARDFVKSVLALRRDPRVQGVELLNTT